MCLIDLVPVTHRHQFDREGRRSGRGDRGGGYRVMVCVCDGQGRLVGGGRLGRDTTSRHEPYLSKTD